MQSSCSFHVNIRKLVMTIVNAYILPHFDFCCVIWGNCTHYLEEKLVRLQKRAARVILDCDFYTTSSTMFSDLKWVLFSERVIYIYESYSNV